ncbi:MAG TPA: tetratricopeptide repeat protein [Phycisphaerae bacterium]|nr:tetratricopeptide repeat protein [Phycisphaerae bacterium]
MAMKSAMTRHPFEKAERRGLAARNLMLGAAAAAAVVLAGGGGYMYWHNHTPSALAKKGELALGQHDTKRAVDFLTQAVKKNPAGDAGVRIRNLLAEALIEDGREADAQEYVQEALKMSPGNAEALDNLQQTYVHPAFRKYQTAIKPLSLSTRKEIFQTIDTGIASLEKLPREARNLVGEAQLDRLYETLEDEGRSAAQGELQAATLAGNQTAIGQAQNELAEYKEPAGEREKKALALLQEAWKLDPKDARAPRLLADYEYQDHRYGDALAVYERVVKEGGEKAVSQGLAITAANVHIADTGTQPAEGKRLSAAREVLEGYLKEHPEDTKVTVALGQVLLEQGDTQGADKMAQKAIGSKDSDIDGQILAINARLKEKKTSDALAMIMPLTASYANIPQVWYVLGMADTDAGDYKGAEEAFRKAVQLDANYALAKRELLRTEMRDGNTSAAQILALDIIREDHYFMPAWAVTCDSLRSHGQEEQARQMLVGLSEDPQLPADARGELAGLLVAVNANDAAAKLIQKMPANDPTTQRLEAEIALSSGNRVEARKMLASAVEADPKNVALRLEYASVLAGSGLSADARGQLDEAAKGSLTPDEATRVARGYLTLRLPERAEAVLKPVLAKGKPSEATELEAQAQAMMEGQAPPAATETANAGTASDPLRAANAALDRKDPGAALTIARNALTKDPNNAGLHLAAARALGSMGKEEEAAKEALAGAGNKPNDLQAYATFVSLFPTADAALRGIGFGQQLQGINGALAEWAIGKLYETAGKPDLAMKDYLHGLDASSRLTESRPARDALYTAILDLDASQKNAAAVKKDADTYAEKDAYFAPGLRLMASDKLLALGDREGSEKELDQLAGNLAADAPAPLVLALVQRQVTMGQADKAEAILKPRATAAGADPQLLDAYATLLETTKPEEALKVRQSLVARDGSNPHYRISLAQTQAAMGDAPGALATLDETKSMGATGKELATSARLRYLISMGLLKEAAAELAGDAGSAKDFASMLAVGRGWEELKRPDEARKELEQIPAYAGEYPAARIALAALDTEAGNPDKGAAALEELSKSSAAAAQQASVPLFHTLLRADKAPAAMELALAQRTQTLANSQQWQQWTLLAAMAAREGKDYAGAVKLLESMDKDSVAASAIDLALLNLLDGKKKEAEAAQGLKDDAPTFNKTFVGLEVGTGKGEKRVLAEGVPSIVIATVAAMPPGDRSGALAEIAKNPRVFPQDIQKILEEAGNGPEAAGRLMKLALANRVLEAGWSTAAVDVANQLEKDGGPALTDALILKEQSLTLLARTSEANQVRDQIAAKFKAGDDVPGVRVLLAASWSKEGKNAEALEMLKPLEATGRADVLTALASLDEKLGRLDDAVALDRKIRAAAPDDVAAANNLAYMLAAAHPEDKGALAEAKKDIEFAVSKAPQVPVFQDTLGWIEILSGEAGDGTKRVAKVLPALRLDPAVHYHLGVGYAKLGQAGLARMHLEDVGALAGTSAEGKVPEVAMAVEALKTLQ